MSIPKVTERRSEDILVMKRRALGKECRPPLRYCIDRAVEVGMFTGRSFQDCLRELRPDITDLDMADLMTRSKTHTRISQARNRIFKNIAYDPTRGRESSIGTMLFLQGKLIEAGDYKGALQCEQMIMKLEGWTEQEKKKPWERLRRDQIKRLSEGTAKAPKAPGNGSEQDEECNPREDNVGTECSSPRSGEDSNQSGRFAAQD